MIVPSGKLDYVSSMIVLDLRQKRAKVKKRKNSSPLVYLALSDDRMSLEFSSMRISFSRSRKNGLKRRRDTCYLLYPLVEPNVESTLIFMKKIFV